MRSDDVRLCEGILRDYPEIRKSLRMRELELLTKYTEEERVDGGRLLPTGQRIVEDREYSDLLKIVETVSGAVETLSSEQRETIRLVYFLGMSRTEAGVELHCCASTVRLWCVKALTRIKSKILMLLPAVDEWRVKDFDEKINTP